jgi:hypothetical protein
MKPKSPKIELTKDASGPNQEAEDNKAAKELYDLIIKAGADLRKKIHWTYQSYNSIYGATSSDPKGYYLYGVLNEVEKACLSMMKAHEWIEKSKLAGIPDSLDDDGQRIRDGILQARIDELTMWQRKMTELMVELVGFRDVNENHYYEHYLAMHELRELKWSQDDLKEYYAAKSENYLYQERELKQQIDRLVPSLQADKCWYVKKDGRKLTYVIDNFDNRFKRSFQKMEVQLKATLRTHYLSFGIQSRSMHVGTSAGSQNHTLDNVSAHTSRVGTLALHVIVLVDQLLGQDEKGVLQICSDIVYKNEYPVDLHIRRTDPDIREGDFVLAQHDLAQVIKVSSNPKYGFKSFRIKYLVREPLPGLQEDVFVGEHVRRIYRGEDLIKQTVEAIKKLNPKAGPSKEEINDGICEGVVLEWSNGLKEYALNEPGGREKLKSFRQKMDQKVAPIKKLIDDHDVGK